MYSYIEQQTQIERSINHECRRCYRFLERKSIIVRGWKCDRARGTLEHVSVTGPLGEDVDAIYGILESSEEHPVKTSIIEMSAAAGITLVEEKDRNPLNTTTFGVGEMIVDANENQVSFGAKGLQELNQITDELVIPELKDCTFRIACDVTNPLCGLHGCSAIFGPQKGATAEMIQQIDNWLDHYSTLSKEKYSHADMNFPGTGAAGGLGFAFLTYTNAVLESGIQIVLEETRHCSLRMCNR